MYNLFVVLTFAVYYYAKNLITEIILIWVMNSSWLGGGGSVIMKSPTHIIETVGVEVSQMISEELLPKKKESKQMLITIIWFFWCHLFFFACLLLCY